MAGQRVSDLAQRLAGLGLRPLEANAIVHLYLYGECKASELARAMRVSRLRSYETLRALQRRGLVVQTLARPARFRAGSPEALFDELQYASMESVRRIDSAKEDLLPAFTALRALPGHALSKNTFRILQGRPAIYRTRLRMIDRAGVSVGFVSTHPGHARLAMHSGLLPALDRKGSAGVRVRGVVRAGCITPAANIDYGVARNRRVVRFLVVDDREVLVWVVNDPSSRLGAKYDVAVWSDAADFVHSYWLLFRAFWSASRELGLRNAPARTPVRGRRFTGRSRRRPSRPLEKSQPLAQR